MKVFKEDVRHQGLTPPTAYSRAWKRALTRDEVNSHKRVGTRWCPCLEIVPSTTPGNIVDYIFRFLIASDMIIPLNISNDASSSNGLLPPQLAQFGTDELVLIEMQGTLEVDGDKAGQTVGKLTIDDKTVSAFQNFPQAKL